MNDDALLAEQRAYYRARAPEYDGIYGGTEDNTYFRRTGDSIDVSGHKRGDVGDVLLLGADGIHSVKNPTRQWTAALHVYGGDFFSHPRLQWDPETGESKPFDVKNARAVLAAADAQARGRHHLSARSRRSANYL